MSDEIKEKIARLPAWARDLIKRLETQSEPMLNEIVDLRRKLAEAEIRYRRLQGRAEVMQEILTAAARGGHETAQAYVDRIVKEYGYDEAENT